MTNIQEKKNIGNTDKCEIDFNIVLIYPLRYLGPKQTSKLALVIL